MSDNIFAKVYEDPFLSTEEWVPLLSDNTNAPVGLDMPSFSARRGVRVAAFFFNVRKSRRPMTNPQVRAPSPFLTLVGTD